MSKGPENTFIASVHKHLPPSLYWMKNHNQYNGGIADCWYSGRYDLWIEYKFIMMPKRDTTIIDLVAGKEPHLSTLQQDWLSGRRHEGRSVWVVVGSKLGGVVHSHSDAWGRKWTAGHYRNCLLTRKEIAIKIVDYCQGHE